LASKLRVTWRKSAIGYKFDQKRTIEALGLRRLGHSVEHEDTRATRGMIMKVRHLVDVTELDGAASDVPKSDTPSSANPTLSSAHPEVSKE
jgi:large subunit ribosomal protein L30